MRATQVLTGREGEGGAIAPGCRRAAFVSNAHARLRVRDRHLDDVGVRVVVQQHDRALRRVHELEHALRRRHLRPAASGRRRRSTAGPSAAQTSPCTRVHRLHDAAADVELLAHQFARVVVQLIVLRFEGEGIAQAKKREARRARSAQRRRACIMETYARLHPRGSA